jgi:hypothetical protein
MNTFFCPLPDSRNFLHGSMNLFWNDPMCPNASILLFYSFSHQTILPIKGSQDCALMGY